MIYLAAWGVAIAAICLFMKGAGDGNKRYDAEMERALEEEQNRVETKRGDVTWH